MLFSSPLLRVQQLFILFNPPPFFLWLSSISPLSLKSIKWPKLGILHAPTLLRILHQPKAARVESSPSAIYGHLSMPVRLSLSLSLQSCTLAISHNTQSYSMREGALKLCRPPLSLSMAKICLLRAFDYESASMTTTTALPCPWCVRAVRNKTQTIKSAKSEQVSTVPYQTLCMLHLRFAWVVL
jgi:hypothetical protein